MSLKGRDIKDAAPGQTVILTVHEMKRLARNAAELMTLAGALQAAEIRLELGADVAAERKVTVRSPVGTA